MKTTIFHKNGFKTTLETLTLKECIKLYIPTPKQEEQIVDEMIKEIKK